MRHLRRTLLVAILAPVAGIRALTARTGAALPRLAALALAAIGLAACAGALSPDGPGDEPYLRGAVASISHGATGSGILVQPAGGCGMMARVDRRTRYQHRGGAGDTQAGAVGEVAVGDTVEVFVSGPVAESCPAQGYAARVVIVAGGSR